MEELLGELCVELVGMTVVGGESLKVCEESAVCLIVIHIDGLQFVGNDHLWILNGLRREGSNGDGGGRRNLFTILFFDGGLNERLAQILGQAMIRVLDA